MENGCENSRKGVLCKILLSAFSVCLVGSMLALAACSPSASAGGSDESKPSSSEVDYASMGYTKFTDEGQDHPYQETYMNEFMKVGNRGCNACHEDLGELVNSGYSYTLHMAASAGTYGKKASWNDCLGCHNGDMYAGANIDDTIHSMHYGNSTFVDELDGNCFSCHAINKDGEWIMWEFYRASEEFGGFKNAGTETMSKKWVGTGYRNHPNDTIAGLSVEADMKVEVTDINQDPTSSDELFLAINHDPCYYEDNVEEYSLTLTGVKNPTTFTYEDLKAMPQTEDTLLHACFANRIGSYQVANIPVKGVLLEDLVEACGGFEDGIQSAMLRGADDWGWPYTPYDLSLLTENGAMIVLEYWGEPMSEIEGYPAVLAIPGIPAGAWIKYIENIDFMSTPGVDEFWYSIFQTPIRDTIYTDLSSNEIGKTYGFGCPTHNSGFFTPCDDDQVLNIENGKVTLSGYAYAWGHAGHAVDQLAFSSDYGNTWTYVDMPEDLDPTKMITWTAEWEPKAPGTYVLYLAAHDNDAGWQAYASFVTVVVE